ncbi:hypothetical protein CDN99_12035 [Roseateles aquatilis]|uniref:Nucleotidyl transferase AbiEii/AbiGii toxin family protein n=1 Tax=Roseateles aquatilis TaxID=431061 RepID=A0A246JE15_9BURK|nr:nucleotidyl transferase AbiEii/AbiGii toxin family protein [Roseateles aquatilis]OWQ90883.1 hypothetical protein CDN99_12035 [Roseateles aquatilis]
MTTREDVREHRRNGRWRVLESLAKEIVADAHAVSGVRFAPHLGGGTRLMLTLEHRISDDIDLFIRDPQWIGFLTPRLNDRFEDRISGYDEGNTSLKFRLPEGEIDFIVGLSLLDLEPEVIPDTTFPVEPIAEVLAKKLFYRGQFLAPRDLFDWYAIEHLAPQSVAGVAFGSLLKTTKLEQVGKALELIPASPGASRSWDLIQAHDKPGLREAADWAIGKLADYAARTAPLPPPPPPKGSR